MLWISAGKYTRAYDSLKQTCTECNLSAPGRITSVSMRKYTATLAQVILHLHVYLKKINKYIFIIIAHLSRYFFKFLLM